MKKEKLVSIADYATMCGVTREAIYARIKSGNIASTSVPNGNEQVKCIDLLIYPPEKLTPGRKPFKVS